MGWPWNLVVLGWGWAIRPKMTLQLCSMLTSCKSWCKTPMVFKTRSMKLEYEQCDLSLEPEILKFLKALFFLKRRFDLEMFGDKFDEIYWNEWDLCPQVRSSLLFGLWFVCLHTWKWNVELFAAISNFRSIQPATYVCIMNVYWDMHCWLCI